VLVVPVSVAEAGPTTLAFASQVQFKVEDSAAPPAVALAAPNLAVNVAESSVPTVLPDPSKTAVFPVSSYVPVKLAAARLPISLIGVGSPTT
jgi:hypothetical protein